MNVNQVFDRLDRGEEFTKEELRDICYVLEPYDIIVGDNRRWTRYVTNIYKSNDGSNRYFALTYDQGLTEDQENFFIDQPIEVKRKPITRTIEIDDWIEAKPHSKARWVEAWLQNVLHYRCSHCDSYIDGMSFGKEVRYNYCPNCGAEMINPEDVEVIN